MSSAQGMVTRRLNPLWDAFEAPSVVVTDATDFSVHNLSGVPEEDKVSDLVYEICFGCSKSMVY